MDKVIDFSIASLGRKPIQKPVKFQIFKTDLPKCNKDNYLIHIYKML